jgi:UDP-2,3-diacylglucosamine hydrolase
MTMNNELPVYFISDAHLGVSIAGNTDREEHLLAFLRSIAPKAGALYIVGDLFDFWIEYKHAIRPDYFPLLHELRSLVEQGVEVHYLAGNHDFALGSFLTDTIGLHIHPNTCEPIIQGKKLHIYHGDGLIRMDVGYRILKKILRNPFNQKLYKLLHPGIGVPLGSLCSGSSRKVTSKRRHEAFLEEYRRCARKQLHNDTDIVVYGHTHCPEIHYWGNKTYCNTGEWIHIFTYAVLEHGRMRLWQYFPGKNPQEFTPKSTSADFSAS